MRSWVQEVVGGKREGGVRDPLSLPPAKVR